MCADSCSKFGGDRVRADTSRNYSDPIAFPRLWDEVFPESPARNFLPQKEAVTSSSSSLTPTSASSAAVTTSANATPLATSRSPLLPVSTTSTTLQSPAEAGPQHQPAQEMQTTSSPARSSTPLTSMSSWSTTRAVPGAFGAATPELSQGDTSSTC